MVDPDFGDLGEYLVKKPVHLLSSFMFHISIAI